jgi:hypothetical protein
MPVILLDTQNLRLIPGIYSGFTHITQDLLGVFAQYLVFIQDLPMILVVYLGFTHGTSFLLRIYAVYLLFTHYKPYSRRIYALYPCTLIYA